jgi:hypothetical protein
MVVDQTKCVEKFVGVYVAVVVLNESGTLQEKILHKPLDLYRLSKERTKPSSSFFLAHIERGCPVVR